MSKLTITFETPDVGLDQARVDHLLNYLKLDLTAEFLSLRSFKLGDVSDMLERYDDRDSLRFLAKGYVDERYPHIPVASKEYASKIEYVLDRLLIVAALRSASYTVVESD